MSDATLLKQFEKLLTANNAVLKQTIREEIEVEIDRLKSDGFKERLNMQVQLNKLTHDLKDLTIVVSKIEKCMEYLADSLKETRSELKAEIKASQNDTIDVLTAVINSGYNLHGKRILRLENKVGLPPIKR